MRAIKLIPYSIFFLILTILCYKESKLPLCIDLNPLRESFLYTITTSNGEFPLFLEESKTPEEKSLGLMHRKSMEKNYGMLFFFNDSSHHKFWMKNTNIPLDIIFLDSNLYVVDFIKKLTPLSTKAVGSKKTYSFALELNAGAIDEMNIEIGNKLYKN